MRDQQKILAKLKSIKEQMNQLEKMLRTGNDTYRVVAGWYGGSFICGLIDLDGMITYSAPKSVNNEAFEKLELMDKFKVITRAVHTAIGMIPVSVLQHYLAEDGPQIELSLSNPEYFEIWAEETDSQYKDIKDMAVGMCKHFKNYRIKITQLDEEEFNELLED